MRFEAGTQSVETGNIVPTPSPKTRSLLSNTGAYHVTHVGNVASRIAKAVKLALIDLELVDDGARAPRQIRTPSERLQKATMLLRRELVSSDNVISAAVHFDQS